MADNINIFKKNKSIAAVNTAALNDLVQKFAKVAVNAAYLVLAMVIRSERS